MIIEISTIWSGCRRIDFVVTNATARKHLDRTQDVGYMTINEKELLTGMFATGLVTVATICGTVACGFDDLHSKPLISSFGCEHWLDSIWNPIDWPFLFLFADSRSKERFLRQVAAMRDEGEVARKGRKTSGGGKNTAMMLAGYREGKGGEDEVGLRLGRWHGQ